MENKEKEQESIEVRKKRNVSLFKRRRKPVIRPFVKESKNNFFKKTLFKLAIVIFIIFLIAGVLWCIRFIFLPFFFENNNSQILKPTMASLTSKEIVIEIENSGFDAEEISVSSDLSLAKFKIHRETEVVLDPRRNLKQDLTVLKAIVNEMVEGNTRAIYIDLRYNKPIVKF